MGEEETGTLTLDDPILGAGFMYHVWEFQGQSQQYVQIDMTSQTTLLDPYLILLDESGQRELSRDDDGGGGLNARIRGVLGREGPFRVVATTLGVGQRGSYTLRVTPLNTPGADSISIVSITPSPELPLAPGTEVTFTAEVSYTLASADLGAILLLVGDEDDSLQTGEQVGATISRGRGTVTLTDRVTIPANGGTTVTVLLPMARADPIALLGRAIVTYRVQ
jgi:hypothetical protein